MPLIAHLLRRGCRFFWKLILSWIGGALYIIIYYYCPLPFWGRLKNHSGKNFHPVKVSMLVNAEFMKYLLVETYSYDENLGEMGMHRCQKGTRIVRDGWRWACL